MRWEFQDPEDVAEARQRQPIVEAMDRWWSAFSQRREQLDGAFDKKTRSNEFDVEEFTVSHLKAIDESLFWEYGPALRTKGHRLVITPEGEQHLLPMLRMLLRRAPKLDGWEFYSGRLPESAKVALPVAEQISRFKASDLRAQVSLGKFRRVDLLFHISNAKQDADGARNYAFRATEQLLGEEVLNRWLGVVDLAPPPNLLERFKKRTLGLVDPDRLKPTVEALLAASRDQLPQTPARIAAQRENPDDVMWSSFELKPLRRADYPETQDLFCAATPERELCEAALSDPLFYSGRFTRSGETFSYLKIDHRPDEQGHQVIHSADTRVQVEQTINAILGEHRVGCTWGGGMGYNYAYFFVALTDVKRSIGALREIAKNLRLNRRSWLLFFDAELRDEWVGLGLGTPAPPAAKSSVKG
jgi:hypothetical protein